MKTNLHPKLLLLVIINLCLSFIPLKAQNYYEFLRVLDPRNSWWGPQGNIDSARFVIEPKGVYAQVDMYLEFSAGKDYYDYSEYDTLEIQLGFMLPEGSIVNDSWLLIGKNWEKALIMDRWTATSIYEGIVQRRRDPSILTKSGSYYNLNVFPLPAKESRKVKISFLVPFNYTISNALLQLPFNILKLSQQTTDHILIEIKEGMGYKNAALASGYGSIITKTGNLSTISNLTSAYDGTIKFDSPLKDGLYLSKYSENNKGVYQLAFLPSQIIKSSTSKNIVILVDHEFNGNITTDEIIKNMKDVLKSNLSGTDSFNVIFSGLVPKKLSDKPITATVANIDSAFSSTKSNFFTGYSELSSLFYSGLIFAEQHHCNSVFLIANTSNFNTVKKANAFLEDLKKTFSNIPPVTVFNYDQSNNGWIWSGNTYLYGNEYFYSVLSRSTGSSNFSIGNQSFSKGFMIAAQSIDTYIPFFDIATSMDNGFTYGNMDILNSTFSVFSFKPILYTGKFTGQFPLEVHISGLINDSVVAKSIVINEENCIAADTFSEKIWAGNYIKQMEKAGNLNNNEISKIIDLSIENRLLSDYTAFLTLEPGVVLEPCEDCNNKEIIDDGDFLPTKEPQISDEKLEIFNNPFTDNLRINLSLKANSDSKLTVKIFNTMGQMIRTMELQTNSGRYEVIWDGKDQNGIEVAKGTYIIRLNAGDYNKTIKAVKK